MRPSSPGMSRAFAEGAAEAGADVDADRARLHRPALLRLRAPRAARARCSPRATTRRRYNGIKMCRAFAAPVGMETGLAEIRDLVAGRRRRPTAERPGDDLRAGRARRLRRRTCSRLAPVRGRHLEVVVDAGNGMAGLTAPAVLGRLDVEVVRALLRARRHLPQPRGQPDRAGQPRRPAGEGARDRRRHRPGLRRRRRPLLPGRRARRAGQPERADRADRRPRAGQGARARRSSTT